MLRAFFICISVFSITGYNPKKIKHFTPFKLTMKNNVEL